MGANERFGAMCRYTFNYDEIVKYRQDLTYSNLLGGLAAPCFLPFSCCIYALFEKQNIEDVSRAQHLAITRDGIRYVVDKHAAGCRLDCQMQGKVSKTVPCDPLPHIHMRAGNVRSSYIIGVCTL